MKYANWQILAPDKKFSLLLMLTAIMGKVNRCEDKSLYS
jgi:hypothetical protein